VACPSVSNINAHFTWTDEKGNPTHDTVDKLQVEPPEVKPWGNTATITVFSETLDPPDHIDLKLEGYGYITVPLSKYTGNGKIPRLPITLKHLALPSASLPAPTPLPAGQGPPALTANR